MTKLLLSMMPSFQSVNLLVPHLGNACIKAYVKEKLPDVIVNTLDLRPYSIDHDIWGPEYTPQITSKNTFVSDIYELPIIASLITRFNKDKTLSSLLKNNNEVIEDWAFERTILPQIVEEKLNKTHEFGLKYIQKFGGYDFVGFSLYVSNLYFSIFMALLIKLSYPKTKIIFGGPQITQSPSTRELLIKTGLADMLVLGEGEQPVVEILKAFENKTSFDEIIGVKTLNNFDKPDTYSQTANVQKLPTPSYEGMPFETFRNKAIPVYANRGCTFRCHFCSEHSLFGKNFNKQIRVLAFSN
ncbi:MAG: B12-binding domain-containing radical SAM protein [Candidatus Sericytochromatia bacterium]